MTQHRNSNVPMSSDPHNVELRRQLEHEISESERAYSEMYDARIPIAITGCYSGAKETLRKAIAIAQQLELQDLEQELKAKLAHIKAVFRSQFASFT